jgi:hypothetical protein
MFGTNEIRFEDSVEVGAIWRSNTGILNIYEWRNKTQRDLDCEPVEPGLYDRTADALVIRHCRG